MTDVENSRSSALPALALSLIVHSADEIAQGIHRFLLRDPAGAELPAFTPGAHLLLEVPCGLVRKYSLCNDPAERDRYVIAVKRETAGRGGSASMTAEARVGMRLAVAPPRNDFPLDARASSVLFIAGGIGIAPIMSMLRHLDATGGARCKLVYCTRDPQSTAFRDELLAPQYHGRVQVHHDGGDPARQFDLWPLLERPAGRHVYCCGPRTMMDAVRDMTGHWSSSAVHFESFVDGTATHKASDTAFRVRLARSGEVVDVPADWSILDALRAAGHEVASSCESGSCGTCRTRLLAGDADHRDLVLTDAERADNIMVCVSRARSDELVLDR